MGGWSILEQNPILFYALFQPYIVKNESLSVKDFSLNWHYNAIIYLILAIIPQYYLIRSSRSNFNHLKNEIFTIGLSKLGTK